MSIKRCFPAIFLNKKTIWFISLLDITGIVHFLVIKFEWLLKNFKLKT